MPVPLNQLTCTWQPQLHADDSSICVIPGIKVAIAYCPPDIVVADLHTSLSGSASLQSDGSLSASGSSTPHSSIFTVSTVMLSQCISGTVDQSALSSKTSHLIQPDLTSTIGEARV